MLRESAPRTEPAPMLLACGGCGAAVHVEAGHRTATCAFCASPSVVRRAATLDRPEPVFGLGFVRTRAATVEAVRRWLASRTIFSRSGVRHASLEDVRGVYVPVYLFGAVARSEYSADIGEEYKEVETYTTTDSKGRTVTRTRVVTKTEWRHLRGRHASYVTDVLVTASRGLPNEELEAAEPFDLRQLRRFSPALVSGWLWEEPSRTREECLELAEGETHAKVGGAIASFLPGDKHRNLRHETRLEEESADLVLVPLWILAVRYDPKKKPFRLIVNGQSGEITGKPPLSWVKIGLAIFAAIAVFPVIAAVLDFLSRHG